MPTLENETGVKHLAGKFSHYHHASIPIKKRRFPGFWPPSPLPEEQSFITSAKEKDKSITSQGPDSSTVRVSTTNSGLSDVNKDTPFEEDKQSHTVTNVNTKQITCDLLNVKVEEPTIISHCDLSKVIVEKSTITNHSDISKVKVEETTITSHSDIPKVKDGKLILTMKHGSSSTVNNTKKFVDAQSSLCSRQAILDSDLQLKARELDTICQGKDISSESKSEKMCEVGVFAPSGNTEPSLSLMDCIALDTAGKNIEGSSQSHETLKPDSLDSSLSKGSFGIGTWSCVDGDRSNWDLNTTMDEWEGTLSDANAKVSSGLKESSTAQSLKPLIHSTSIVGVNIASENQVIKNKQNVNIPVVPQLAGQICKSDGTLHLGRSLHLVRAQDSSSKDMGNVISKNDFPRSTITMGNRCVTNRSIVKQEPINEYIRQNVKESKENRWRLVDFRTIKQESVERRTLDAILSKGSISELSVPALIKSEISKTSNEILSLASNHSETSTMDADDDFEDGEVRETDQCAITRDYAGEERESEHNVVNSDKKGKCFVINAGNDYSIMSHAEERENKQEDFSRDDCKVETVIEEKINDFSTGDSSLQIPSTDEFPVNSSDGKKLDEAPLQRKSHVIFGGDVSKAIIEREQSSDTVNYVNCGAVRNILPSADGSSKTDAEINNYPAFPNVDTALNNGGMRNYSFYGDGHSQIIHLPPNSNASSTGKSRSLSSRLSQSPKPERFSEMMIDRNRIRPRGRGEGYMSRERRPEKTVRTFRTKFVPSKGMISSRMDKVHEGGDVKHNALPNYYNSHTDFCVARHKYLYGVGDTKNDNCYKIVSDASFAENGWDGRKLITNEVSRMDHLPSRRSTPHERDDPGGQRIHKVRRVPRNNTPSRNMGDDRSELVGRRHNQKFLRGCPEDVRPMLTHPRPAFEGVGDHFAEGSRSIPSVKRRGPSRMRSRSPIRSRARSPHPWCSPIRRTPDGFREPWELPHRRSPMYRTKRTRSSGRSCLPRKIVDTRHGSPPSISQSFDLAQENGHLRSATINRNPTDRFN